MSVVAGRCMYAQVGWVGVGWGGACNNVHVKLRRKDTLVCGCLDRITGSSIICPDGNRAWKFAAERRGIPLQSVVHQVKNFTSEGPKMCRGVSNIAHKRWTGLGSL